MPLATSAALPLPLFASRLRAGFPSPADDYLEGKIDLNKYLVEHEAATFLVRIEGDSMTGTGIFHDDIAIVDRSLVTSEAFPRGFSGGFSGTAYSTPTCAHNPH